MAYDRSGGKAGSDIVLQLYIQHNGEGADVFDLDAVEIYDPNGVLIDTITSIQNIEGIGGLYQIQWTVPIGAETGRWSDVWKGIKVTPIAEAFDSTNYFFVIPEAQVSPNTDTTRIYFYATYPNGEPQAGVYGYAQLLDTPYYTGGRYFTNPLPQGVRATANSEGLLLWTLPQGARVRFSIPSSDVILYKQVPATSTDTNMNDLEDFLYASA